MGHLTRCMASARRLSTGVVPVIVTMSKAFDVVRDEGIAVEYLPFMRSAGLEYGEWTAKLAREMAGILDYHRPNVVVFDGNVPYEGLMQALESRPAIWRVWQRRPFWRPDAGKEALAAASRFDMVLEPAELADPVDRGPTKAAQGQVLRVPPIRFLDAEEALAPEAARQLLGIGGDRPVILAQLGAGNNWDLDAVLALLVARADPAEGPPPFDLVVARWRISERDRALPPHVRVLDAFPIARWLAAFDAAVAVAGYNTFHENLAAGLPTLFLSNDHPEQDEQWLRAHYAALRGLALAARREDAAGVQAGLADLLRGEVRAWLGQAMAALDLPNGAAAAACALEGLALTRKASRLAFRPAEAAE
jgi:UDP:flavonoid glycosyltransferase YjiC (YdhE family)